MKIIENKNKGYLEKKINMFRLKTKKYMVGYLDLLGTKDITYSKKNNDLLNILHISIKHYIDFLQVIMPHMNIKDYKIKVFSDNIIIAIPCQNNKTDDNSFLKSLTGIQNSVRYIQRYFLERNLLSRGAVTFGDFFIDDHLVWGPAIIRVYELENSIALYPRVIVDDNIINIAKKYNKLLKAKGHYEDILEKNLIKKDFDGIYFFDYLGKEQITKEIALNSLIHIEQKIQNETDKKILQKMDWHKNYLLYCKKKWDKS